jgi:hypothetical protein
MRTEARPIFVLGILRRSGTNYLSDLLVQHPDCVSAAPIHEDHLVQRADHLRSYVDAVTSSWTESWGVPPDAPARLMEALGDGVAAFLQAGAGARRVVAKTPRTEHLDLYGELFPHCPLLLLVRDGRNVVASNVRSFDEHEEVMRQEWARAGRRILEFDARNRDGGIPYRIVRYEDLFADLQATMTAILRTCGLDPDRYDFEVANRLPVRGSSSLRHRGEVVHWEPVDRDERFRPNEHWRDWTPYQHARFAEVAGDVQRAFGYDVEPTGPMGAASRARRLRDRTAWGLRVGRRRLLGRDR